MSTDKELFEKYWADFQNKLKGKLLRQFEKQECNFKLAELILSESSLGLYSEYDACGRWLKKYSAESPDKGELIRQILLEDMHFTEITSHRGYNEALNYVIPVVGAAAGFGIASVAAADAVVKAVSTIAPAAVLYFSTKAVGDSMKDASKRNMIDEYISQLEKYKLSVLNILSD